MYARKRQIPRHAGEQIIGGRALFGAATGGLKSLAGQLFDGKKGVDFSQVGKDALGGAAGSIPIVGKMIQNKITGGGAQAPQAPGMPQVPGAVGPGGFGGLFGQGGGAGLMGLAQNALGMEAGGGIPHNPDLAGAPYKMRGVRLMKSGGINEYGAGGNIYADNGVKTPGSDQDQPSGRSFKPGEAFMMSGFENQPDAEGMVSGRERMYVVMPGADGQDPRSLDLRSAAKEFGYDNAAAMARAMGVETERGPGGGLTFSSTTDPAYNKRLQEAFGGESLEDVQSKLDIGRVAYDRERDLPNIVRAATPGGRQSYGGRVRAIRK